LQPQLYVFYIDAITQPFKKQHKKLKKKVNQLEKYLEKCIDWLKDNIDKPFTIK